MSQEEKELLLKDLSARLPYEVKIKLGDYDYQVSGYNSEKEMPLRIWYYYDSFLTLKSYIDVYLTDYRPYLRPMSSMTEEEEKEYNQIVGFKGEDENGWIRCDNIHTEWGLNLRGCNKLVSWLDKNHFDHRTDEKGKTLIEKGLAIEAPEDMYKI